MSRATTRRANFKESKPQQTGTGLLIRHGEVATTSGSTNSLPGRLIVGQRPLKARMLVRFQPPAANLSERDSVSRSMCPVENDGKFNIALTNDIAAGHRPALLSPGGEIESRLAYTQKSEGQNLSGRPFASLHNQECAGL